jgi:hypothetical protein
MHEITGSESSFIRFRIKVTAILAAILIGLSAVFVIGTYALAAVDWRPAYVVGAVILYWTVMEMLVFQRIKAGAFGQTRADELLWKQYVRFRDKKPGRWLNRDD